MHEVKRATGSYSIISRDKEEKLLDAVSRLFPTTQGRSEDLRLRYSKLHIPDKISTAEPTFQGVASEEELNESISLIEKASSSNDQRTDMEDSLAELRETEVSEVETLCLPSPTENLETPQTSVFASESTSHKDIKEPQERPKKIKPAEVK